MRKLIYLLVLVGFSSFHPFLEAEKFDQKIPPFVLITVPKSGSHLTIKALYLLTGGISIWHTRFPSFYYIPPNEGFLYTHFCITPQLERDYSELPRLKKIINIRDLRDVCVSIVNQIKKAPWPGMDESQRREFLNMSFEEQLLFVINFDYDTQEVAAKAPNSLQVSVSKIAEQAKLYCAQSNNLVCRYENLVGEMGGGSEKAQVEELKKIVKFLEISATEKELKAVASCLYGDEEFNPFGRNQGLQNYRSTFKKGQIGSWKRAFNDKTKAAFKAKLGQALIDLGYETNNKW